VGVAALALSAAACGPEASVGFSPGSARDALGASVEALEFTSEPRRARLYEQLEAQARAQAGVQLADGLAVFAIERGGVLVASELPAAEELISGAPGRVDLDRSPDPWPVEPRDGLGGLSERELAERAGAVFAARLELPADAPVIVERAAGAPYAAAFVHDRLRLNPALLYLAAARPATDRGAGPR
jgi:hypothetical protein